MKEQLMKSDNVKSQINIYSLVDKGIISNDKFSTEKYSSYVNRGGYGLVSKAIRGGFSGSFGQEQCREIIRVIENSGLTGRGGAGFPTAKKISSLMRFSENDTPTVVIANGGESEPLSSKDRYLMRYMPHLVLDGLLIVSILLKSINTYVYVEDEDGFTSIKNAVDELKKLLDKNINLFVKKAPKTYVAAEESAVIRSISEGISLPTDKPPRPYQKGLYGVPTLVLNVETLAWIAMINNKEYASHECNVLSTFTLSDGSSHIVEVAPKMTLGDLLDFFDVDLEEDRNMICGGFFGGVMPINPSLQFNQKSFKDVGSSLGSASFRIIGKNECPISIAADIAAFFSRNNAKQCGVCISGTSAVTKYLSALSIPSNGKRFDKIYKTFESWANQLPKRGACAIPDGTALLLSTVLKNYPDLLKDHTINGCEICAANSKNRDRWKHLRSGFSKN